MVRAEVDSLDAVYGKKHRCCQLWGKGSSVGLQGSLLNQMQSLEIGGLIVRSFS